MRDFVNACGVYRYVKSLGSEDPSLRQGKPELHDPRRGGDMCRTYGAGASLFPRTQRLHAGLTCGAPTALKKEERGQGPDPRLRRARRVGLPADWQAI